MLLVGVVLVAEAVVTVAWQEPLSALYNARQQSELTGDLRRQELRFDALRAKQEAAADREEAAAERAAEAALRREWAALRRETAAVREEEAVEREERTQLRVRDAVAALETVGIGSALGRLSIDKIGLDTVFVQGHDDATLRRGPGHYLGTALPGQRGTVGIAGHRTTYSAPFRDLNQLGKGDEIRVDMPYGEFTYAVTGTKIVQPTEVGVLSRTGHDRLVLTACHPLSSSSQRIVVFARLDARRLS